MRKLLLASSLLLLVACGRSPDQAPNNGSQAGQVNDAATSPQIDEGGFIVQPSYPLEQALKETRPIKRHVYDFNQPHQSKLTSIKPQPEPTYQEKGPDRPVTIGSQASSDPSVPSAPAPNTAGLFGAASPQTSMQAAPAATTPPVPSAEAQQLAAQSMASMRAQPIQQAISFEECSKNLQGVLAHDANIKVVQNDAAAYAVELSTPMGAQRITCSRNNIAVISVH